MFDFIWDGLLSWIQKILIQSMDLININILYLFSPRLLAMDIYFPFFKTIYPMVVWCAYAMIIALFLFKLYQNFLLTASRSYESPLVLTVRMILSFILVMYLPVFTNALLSFADTIYWDLIKKETIIYKEALFQSLSTVIEHTLKNGWETLLSMVTDVMTDVLGVFSPLALIGNSVKDTAIALVSLCLTVMIAWNYFKLVIQLIERYIVVGIMYYTMPLACVPIVSRETASISKAWVRMFISELILIVLNLAFVMAFRISVGSHSMIQAVTIEGHKTGGSLVWCFTILAFLKAAQSIDAQLSRMGFSTPALTNGLAGSLGSLGSNLKRDVMMASRMGMGGRGAGPMKGEARAASNFSKQSKDGKIVRDDRNIKGLSLDKANDIIKKNNSVMQDRAAVEYAKKIIPKSMQDQFNEKVSNGNLISAEAGYKSFNIKYKDKNGNEATLSFSEKKPDGISKQISIGDTEGYLKDTGASYDVSKANEGQNFEQFAQSEFGGKENFISDAGHYSEEELSNATVTAASDGSDGLILKDSDGYEIAKISPFDDQHSDNLTDNTIIGEGKDGLYRVDFNDQAKMPLPDGYSYVGEVCLNDDNKLVEGNDREQNLANGNHYQDSYKTPTGEYISSDDMRDMMHDKYVYNGDYANNIKYDEKSGFTDMNDNPIDVEKAGWKQASDGSGLYENRFTGASSTGEQIAEHMANPEYASLSYGGIDNDGNSVYVDNATQKPVKGNSVENARRYGELPTADPTYNENTGEFSTNNGPKNFGESVENLLSKDYSFTGNVGKNIAKRLKGFEVEITAVDIKKIEENIVDKFYYLDELKKAVEKADAIFITLPLVEETYHLINGEIMDAMKEDAIIINVARGKLIDEEQLIDRMKRGKFCGVALDVFETEPLEKESELWNFERVIVTPHNSFVGNGNQERIFKRVLENLRTMDEI